MVRGIPIMTNKLIVIFNGPPDSGKDHAAKYFSKKFGAPHFEMKGALRKTAHKMAAVAMKGKPDYINVTTDLVQLDAVGYCDSLEYNKTLKSTLKVSLFGDRTWREFLIHISEDIMKPIFGQDVFGRAARKLVRESTSPVCFFSDGGFQVEVEELRKEGTVLVFQLSREGCSWGDDSRGYITGDLTCGIYNEGSEDWLRGIEVWLNIHTHGAGIELEAVNEDPT
jgi:hypothetical protein